VDQAAREAEARNRAVARSPVVDRSPEVGRSQEAGRSQDRAAAAIPEIQGAAGSAMRTSVTPAARKDRVVERVADPATVMKTSKTWRIPAAAKIRAAVERAADRAPVVCQEAVAQGRAAACPAAVDPVVEVVRAAPEARVDRADQDQVDRPAAAAIRAAADPDKLQRKTKKVHREMHLFYFED
jgi:hypothetical protein